ncbi:MAG: T9SS type A sorting domain-containing protein, partial [Bacteroidales bacterium]
IGTHSVGLSDEAEILDFTFGTAIDYEDAVIDSELATVDISVIKGTDVTELSPTISISDYATIDPESGDTIDFTNPVIYTVTAQDGVTTKDWTVTVTELTELSDKANIVDVELADVDSIKINDTDTTVTIYAPYGFDVTLVKPEFTVSAGATIADTTDARDFTNPQIYVVTAQDGSTIKNWEVSIVTTEPMELTIYEIQYTEDASGDSPYLDEFVKTSGIVTGVGEKGFFMQASAEEWNGIYVYTPDGNTATLGDSAWVVGTVDEYRNGTQISYVKDYIVIEQDVTLPDPIEITDLANTLTESHEGMLVKLINIECTDGPSSYEEWTFTDESGDEIMVDDILGYQHTFTIGAKYSITGLRQTYFGDKITPRNDDDIVDVSTGINNPDEIVSMNVYPNPSNGAFTLEMNASKAGTFKVEIINIQGQVVYQKQITQDGFYRESIDISDKARGMYYIRLNDGQSMKITKIMIQ